jgi:hypothetical protein
VGKVNPNHKGKNKNLFVRSNHQSILISNMRFEISSKLFGKISPTLFGAEIIHD